MSRIAACLITLFAMVPHRGQAESAPPDSIVFLHLRVGSGGVRLDRVQVRAGTLKLPRMIRARPGEIRFTVSDAQGRHLHEALMPDPTHVVYEYVDDQGQFRQRVVEKDSADAVVRIPYDPRARTVRFQKLADVARGRAGRSEQAALRGTITLDLKAARDDR